MNLKDAKKETDPENEKLQKIEFQDQPNSLRRDQANRTGCGGIPAGWGQGTATALPSACLLGPSISAGYFFPCLLTK